MKPIAWLIIETETQKPVFGARPYRSEKLALAQAGRYGLSIGRVEVKPAYLRVEG